MKLRDYIVSLDEISRTNPDADIRFQNIDIAEHVFTESRCEFIEARAITPKDCVVTFGPEKWISENYKRFADNRQPKE